MLHKSEFDTFGHQFPHDSKGHVPVHGDQWLAMQFDHADMDPHHDCISDEESTRRMEYLNTVWWPSILQQVQDERIRLEAQHGESFIKHWERVTKPAENSSNAFGVGNCG